MKLKPRHVQLLVGGLGAILIVPWAVFMGVMFTFAFRSDESLWAWVFDIISFWCQVPAILLSFLKPRIGAYWLLANTAVSVLFGLVFQIESALKPDARSLSAVDWIKILPQLAKSSFWFWGLPILFALLLLMAVRGQKPTERDGGAIPSL